MKKRTLPIVVIFAILMTFVLMISPAGAVTNGELDGEDHPNVVLLLMEIDGVPRFRCSGTLLSPTVLLTAGHCTNGFPDFEFSGMRIFTQSDVDQGTLDGTNNYPFKGPNSIEAKSWAAHPLYETAPFFVHDVGVVILKGRGVRGLAEYGVLPEVDELDKIAAQNRLKEITFTSVGYGLQQVNAAFFQADRVRMFANPHLLQINVPGFTGDFSLLLSNNTATGGTCFGDSGGPNFLGDSNVVAGVTSFGLNGSCGGTGGVFRMDRQNVLDFVNSYFK